ncbi:MAG: hypothetical protein KAI66_05420 [Lentisphaeria bacterium]|nr:hypothetical protein [Lentisphaeria bacterium]
MTEDNTREISLEALVSKLHDEGVGKGQTEAARIIAEAEKKAEEICRGATDEAKALVKMAQAQAEEFQQNANASVKQAARDTMLALNRSVCDLFRKAFQQEAGTVLDSPEFLKGLILTLAEDWAKGKSIEVAVKPELGKQLLALSQTGVAGMLAEGIEIKQNRSITKGFRIRLEGDQVAYDFSDESIVESLKLHLNPQLIELLEL